MKIVVAMDSFKGSLTSREAGEAVREGLCRGRPRLDVRVVPMADGGEGTVAALMAGRRGEWISRRVAGSLGATPVQARFAWFPRGSIAALELAAANGLTLLDPAQRNPLLATTWGTGELIREALSLGPRQLWVAVGGSATVDGGVGAAAALGWRFLDRRGVPIRPVGGELIHIETVLPPEDLTLPPVLALCDVDHVLSGPRGAARTFGPQKGATAAMVNHLDEGLRHLADTVARQLGTAIDDLPHGGAGGGFAAGARAFLDARLDSGIRWVIQEQDLRSELRDADWVVTGEGQLDAQSFRGKVLWGIVELAGACNVPVAVVVGRATVAHAQLRRFGVSACEAAQPQGMPLAEAMDRAGSLVAAAADRLAEVHLVGE